MVDCYNLTHVILGCNERTVHWFIGTHAHGRQVTSVSSQSDFIM